MVGISIPVFWLAAVLLNYLTYKTEIFPSAATSTLTEDPLEWAYHLILPWFTLAILYVGFYSRVLRSNMLDAMNEDYVRTARAKGLSERQVMTRHVLRNSLIPIVTLFGLDFGASSPAARSSPKSLFSLNGVGQYAAEAIGKLDLPPIMAITLFGAFFVVLFNALVDIAYAYLDPRVRLGELGAMSARAAALGQRPAGRLRHRRRARCRRSTASPSTSPPGEVLAIVGESGSGKSVTAQTIIGLTRSPNARIEGSVKLDGEELIDAERRRAAARCAASGSAMVFQDPMTSLQPGLPGRRPDRRGDPRPPRRRRQGARRSARAVELLDSVGIPDAERRVDDYPHEFSGGMRQRAMIAMALALEPEVLIADEPTTALDVTIQAQILRPARAAQPRARPGDDPDHPRPRRRRRGRRPGAGDVRRAGGRGGDARRDLLRPPAPLHLGPARLADPARPAAAAAAAADQRRAALAARPAARAARSGRAARTSSPTARELPALEARLAEAPDHRDRCWLEPEREAREAAGRGPDRAGGAGLMQRSGEPLLEVTDLVKHFPIKRGLLIDREVDQVRAVDGVSFSVAPRRDARPGRRVGQRQVDALPGGAAAARADLGLGPLRGPRDRRALAAARCGRCGARCR